jgi:hypothetical protein
MVIFHSYVNVYRRVTIRANSSKLLLAGSGVFSDLLGRFGLSTHLPMLLWQVPENRDALSKKNAGKTR